MKKIIVMVTAIMMAATTVSAQEEENFKHEVAVSYGGMSNSMWMTIGETLGTVIGTLGAIRYDDGSFTGPLALEYFYHINPVVGIGAVGVYGQEKQDMFIGNSPWGEAKNTYVSVLPAAKFNYLRKKYFGMYSKVAVGVTFRTQKEDYPNSSSQEDVSKSKVLFNWQVTGLGVEAGSQNIRAFVELGIGEQGMALAGLRCKF